MKINERVILVRGLKPDEETMAKSKEENIPLLGTGRDTFRMAGQLYEILSL